MISSYLKIRNRLKKYIKEAVDRGVIVSIAYRSVNWEEEQWLKSLGKNVSLIENKDLHAKCYLNEKEAVVTSMNLYEHSQDHNYEMGVLIDDAEKIFQQIRNSAQSIINHSIPSVPNNDREKGFCIRCKAGIDLDLNKPYCYDCYLVWAEYVNYQYQEQFCHACGQPYPSTINKPLCFECYRKIPSTI